jgi:DNA-binding NtrC family response regulator
MKVLIVDDEPEVLETLGEYLRLHDMEVLEAANGLEALLHVKRERPSAVVLDLRMPRLGGIEALKRIRAFDAGIAVIVVTGDIDEAVHRQAIAAGAQAVFTKPLALDELVSALRGADGASRGVAAAPAEVAAVPAEDPRSAATRVLVVDDDDAVREMLVEFLASQGYETSTAVDAGAGIAALVATSPDVMLLDINMPGLSGDAALPAIRAAAPRVAVIMVSGTADEDLAKRTLAQGAFDYLVKPVDLTYLAQSIETAVTMRALDA